MIREMSAVRSFRFLSSVKVANVARIKIRGNIIAKGESFAKYAKIVNVSPASAKSAEIMWMVMVRSGEWEWEWEWEISDVETHGRASLLEFWSA